MFRWWKKPGVRTITFTPTREAAKAWPPIPMKRALPNWYKLLHNEIYVDGLNAFNMQNDATGYTMKKCVPVMDYATSGYLIRHNAETMISVRNDEDGGQVIFHKTPAIEEHKLVSYHGFKQCPILIEGERKTYVKFSGGHVIRTPPGYSTLFYQPGLHFEDRYTLLPGIVDTDTYDAEIYFPGWVNKGVTDFLIEAGAPMIVAFPFKRDEWQSEVCETLTDQAGKEMRRLQHQFITHIYRNFFHRKKRYD